MTNQFLTILGIILSILLTVLVLIQAKGTGLGSTFGGDFSFYHTKRGVEKILFSLTIIVVSLFLLSAILRIIL